MALLLRSPSPRPSSDPSPRSSVGAAELASRVGEVLCECLAREGCPGGVYGAVDLGVLGSELGRGKHESLRRQIRSRGGHAGALLRLVASNPDVFYHRPADDSSVVVGLQTPPPTLEITSADGQVDGTYSLVSGASWSAVWVRTDGLAELSAVRQGWLPAWAVWWVRDSRRILAKWADPVEAALPHRCKWAGGVDVVAVCTADRPIDDDAQERGPRPWQCTPPPPPPARTPAFALRPNRVRQRWRQIMLGYGTAEYRSLQQIDATRPETPDIYSTSSKRAFDTQVRTWRRELHHAVQCVADAAAGSPLSSPRRGREEAAVQSSETPPPPLGHCGGSDVGVGEEEQEEEEEVEWTAACTQSANVMPTVWTSLEVPELACTAL